MNPSAAISGPLLRQACGWRARPSPARNSHIARNHGGSSHVRRISTDELPRAV